MKTMFFIQTHSDYHTWPEAQIKKNLFLHNHLIKKFQCDFFVMQEGFDHLPNSDKINYFEYGNINSNKINFCITGIHEPRKNVLKDNGWIISFQPGSIKAVIKAMEIAIKHNYDKVVYFDHDIQFFSDKIENEFFNTTSGSSANMSKQYNFPETAFFVIHKDCFEVYYSKFKTHLLTPLQKIVDENLMMENLLHLTHRFSFKGDRFGDWGLPDVFDLSYDYVSQLPYWNYYEKSNNYWVKKTITTELDNIWF